MSPAPGGSLAVLAGNDRTYIYRLGYEAGPLAFVGERFYVKPLLKNFQFGSHYFLLGLSADRFAFVHGDFGSLERVELPRDVLDAFSEEFRSCTTGMRVRWTTRRSRTICRPTTAGSRTTT